MKKSKILLAVTTGVVCFSALKYIKEKTTVEDIEITNADEALERLKDGNKRFKENHSKLINVTSKRRKQLKNNQHPYAIIISCSDSRVTPSTIFNAGLGELFNIRLAGNIIDRAALGSIEYGVEHLKSPLIVVMGHENCGAVSAAYENIKHGESVHGNITSIVKRLKHCIECSDSLNDAINKNIDNVVNQIKNDEIVTKAISEGKVKVVGAYYSFDGTVTFRD